MTRAAVFCLAVSVATFGCAFSLKCYSCASQSPDNCTLQQQCLGGDDSCLELTGEGAIFAGCVRYSDCNFMTLGSKYVLPDFTFSCCQSNLCNGKKNQKKNWFLDLFG